MQHLLQVLICVCTPYCILIRRSRYDLPAGHLVEGVGLVGMMEVLGSRALMDALEPSQGMWGCYVTAAPSAAP